MTGGERDLDRTKLFAARHRAAQAQPFLAGALYAMTVVSSPSVLTMGVDRHWRCYAAPAFVAATDVEHLAGVWLHEVAHLLRRHHARARALFERSRADADAGRPSLLDPDHPRREQLRLNLAMDCEINGDLIDALVEHDGVRLPDKVITAARLGLEVRPVFEQYLHQVSATFTDADLAWMDCGSGAHDGEVPWELDGTGAHPLSDAQAAAIRYRVAEQIHRGTGRGSAGWKRWADDVTDPRQDWRRLLQTTIRHSLNQAGGAVDYAYRRPGRRTAALAGKVVLPSLVKPVPSVAVVIDTSASVADTELGAALGETAGILEATGRRGPAVTVYSCDAAVHSAQTICSTAQVTLAGGGGTDLRQGLLRAQGARPRPDVIVVLTDGHTPWPTEPPAGRVIAGLLGPPPSLDEFGEWHPAPPPPWVRTVQITET